MGKKQILTREVATAGLYRWRRRDSISAVLILALPNSVFLDCHVTQPLLQQTRTVRFAVAVALRACARHHNVLLPTPRPLRCLYRESPHIHVELAQRVVLRERDLVLQQVK